MLTNQKRHNCAPMNHRSQLQQEERHIGRSGRMIPPGYYEAWEEDDKYYLYPIVDEDTEDRRYLNERTGIALQVATLCMRVISRIQAGGGVYSQLGSPHPSDIQICDSALGNIANESCRPFHRGGDTDNFFHTNKEPEPRNPKDLSKVERVICHAKVRDEKLYMEARGILKDLGHMTGGAKRVVEPVFLVRASKFVVQTAKPLVILLNPCDLGITSESEVCSDAGENKSKRETIEIDDLAFQSSPLNDEIQENVNDFWKGNLKKQGRFDFYPFTQNKLNQSLMRT